MKRRRITREEGNEIRKMKGLGDLIKKGTDKLGIKQCGGCKKRQEWLNQKFPFKDSLDSEDMDE
jgi:hypothetical protein